MMKRVKQLEAVPESLQDFLKEYPPKQRDKGDWNTFKNEGHKAYRLGQCH